MEREGKWWSREEVAVVTGANRGIGLEIVRQLADEGLTVVMTARKRREELSPPAQAFLQEARENVVFHTLDISQTESISDFTQWLKLNIGFLDILINNAGISMLEMDWEFMQKNNVDANTIIGDLNWMDGISEKYESAKQVFDTNYHGTKSLTKALLPLLRPSPHKPRIVNISSYLGLLRFMRDEELRKQLSDMENLSEEKIDEALDLFLEDVKFSGKDLKNGTRWPVKFPSYSLSKMALSAYTRLLARELDGKACVNSVHPGYVRTDMTMGTGTLSTSQGAHNVVSIALLPSAAITSGHNFLETHDSGYI